MRAVTVTLSMLALSACSSRDLTARASWPELEGLRSMILIADPFRGPRVAQALEDPRSAAVVLPFSDGVDEVELHLLAYDAPLSELGLRAGPLELGMDRPLPEPQRTLKSQLTSSTVGAWAPDDFSAGALAAVKLASSFKDACKITFPAIAQRMRLPGEAESGKTAVALPLGDGTALFGTRSGNAYRVSKSAVEPIAELSGAASYLGGARDARGELWIARSDALLRGGLDRGFTRLPTFPGRVTNYLWLDVVEMGSAVDLLALSDEGEVARFDGAQWTPLFDVTDEHIPGKLATGSIRHTPGGGAVLMVPVWYPCGDNPITCAMPLEHEMGSKILRLEGDTPIEYPAVMDALMSLDLDSSGRILVGTFKGPLLRRQADDLSGIWETIGTAPAYVWSLAQFQGGILVGTGRGEFQAFFPRIGLCPPRSLALGHVRHIVPLEDTAEAHTFVFGLEADIANNVGGDYTTVISW